jgi:hypothetical protein
MAEFDVKDLYIGYEGHPKFQVNGIITDDIIRIIIQKYEMLIFSNKGDLYGDPDFGCDLEQLLHQTRISSESVVGIINEQISVYIPELASVSYQLEVEFFEDPELQKEIMVVELTLLDLNVLSIIE